MNEPLAPTMDNVLASMLGEIAGEAGDPDRTKVGDFIDRGLVLRQMLANAGFVLTVVPGSRAGVFANPDNFHRR